MSKTSDGSTAEYYELPRKAKELQDLISYRDMNAQIGEIFRACYRYGQVSHSDKLRDAKKMRFYAQAEIDRLEKQHGGTGMNDEESHRLNDLLDHIYENGTNSEGVEPLVEKLLASKRTEIEQLESVISDADAAMYEAIAEMERLREICDGLHSDKERLRKTLFDISNMGMVMQREEHRIARNALAQKEDKT